MQIAQALGFPNPQRLVLRARLRAVAGLSLYQANIKSGQHGYALYQSSRDANKSPVDLGCRFGL